MRFVFLPALAALAGCKSPCEELNEDLVKFWDDCEVELPSDLKDGGHEQCDIEHDVADCTAKCYDDGGCEAIDGSDPDAASALADCTAGCLPPAE